MTMSIKNGENNSPAVNNSSRKNWAHADKMASALGEAAAISWAYVYTENATSQGLFH